MLEVPRDKPESTIILSEQPLGLGVCVRGWVGGEGGGVCERECVCVHNRCINKRSTHTHTHTHTYHLEHAAAALYCLLRSHEVLTHVAHVLHCVRESVSEYE
jgi:hypothetical protein